MNEDERERFENERELQTARMERKAAEVVERRLVSMWRDFGVEYDTGAGRDVHRELLEWLRARKRRSEGFNKRAQSYVVMAGAITTMAAGLIKWLLDVAKSGGFNGPTH